MYYLNELKIYNDKEEPKISRMDQVSEWEKTATDWCFWLIITTKVKINVLNFIVFVLIILNFFYFSDNFISMKDGNYKLNFFRTIIFIVYCMDLRGECQQARFFGVFSHRFHWEFHFHINSTRMNALSDYKFLEERNMFLCNKKGRTLWFAVKFVKN